MIITEAKVKRDNVIEEKHNKLAELETRIHELEFTRKSFYSRLKSELESYLKLINQTESDSSVKIEPPGDQSMNRIVEHIQNGNKTNEEL